MSPPQNPTIFLLGATGYVGGCYLNQLLSGSSTPKKITVLSRSAAKFDLVKGLSTAETLVEPLSGSFDDHDLITQTAYEHDITIEAGDSDNPGLVDALLRGMKKRKEEGNDTTFIHVSGTGTLADDARGEYKSDIVYTDSTPKPPHLVSLNDLTESAFHRKIDLSIYEADEQGWCESYLIFPGTIWGANWWGVRCGTQRETFQADPSASRVKHG